MDKCKVDIEEQIDKLIEQKNKMLEDLDMLKKRFEREEIDKQEKERKVEQLINYCIGIVRYSDEEVIGTIVDEVRECY